MKKFRTSNKKYPLKIKLSDGHMITIPKQSALDNAWLKKHGCSIMAEFVALQYLGIFKWPIRLLRWHRRNTKSDVKSKVTVLGVFRGIKRIGAKKGTAVYYKEPTAALIESALKSGHLVIMEQKNPIHSITLIRDKGVTYLIDHGAVKKTSVKDIAKTATSNATYRGMVVVKRK